MSKVLVIPDVHLKTDVIERGRRLADKFMATKIIMLGDYFDDWYAIQSDYTKMIDYLKNLLKKDPRIIPLFGNHELSYLGYPCSGYTYYSGIRNEIFDWLIKDYRFAFCYAEDGVLYSHAGICTGWLWDNKICTANDIRYKLTKKGGAEIIEKAICKIDCYPRSSTNLRPFSTVGPARGGGARPSLVWADLTELVADPIPIKQVVGHTPVQQIENIGRCWFTDVYSNSNVSDEYLLVNDGEPRIVHYNEEFPNG